MKQELSWFNNELKRDKCSMMHQNYNSRNVHTSRQIKNLNINCLVTRTAISIFVCFLTKALTYNVLVTMSLIKICLIKDRKVKLSIPNIPDEVLRRSKVKYEPDLDKEGKTKRHTNIDEITAEMQEIM